MSVLVEALNRSALLKNEQPSQPQARPMPRVVPVLGMAAGVCVGFAAIMAAGSLFFSPAAPRPAEVRPVSVPIQAPTANPVPFTDFRAPEHIRVMPILEPLAADLGYHRTSKPAAPASQPAKTAAPAAPTASAAAKPLPAEAAPGDPKTSTAIKALEAQLERQPENLETMSQLLGLVSAQPPQAALVDLLRLYQAYPRQHVLAAQLGYTYARLNDQESALRYQQWAVTIAPNNAVYLFNVAVLQDRLGKREEATRNYQQALLRSNAGGPPVPTAAIRERLDYLARN